MMEKISIEDRAAAFADSKISGKVGKQCIAIGYIHGAQEQDRISRQEERERCIKVAQEWYCQHDCKGGYCPQYSMCLNCNVLDSIRKAMEGGES